VASQVLYFYCKFIGTGARLHSRGVVRHGRVLDADKGGGPATAARANKQGCRPRGAGSMQAGRGATSGRGKQVKGSVAQPAGHADWALQGAWRARRRASGRGPSWRGWGAAWPGRRQPLLGTLYWGDRGALVFLAAHPPLATAGACSAVDKWGGVAELPGVGVIGLGNASQTHGMQGPRQT
jgi:hypothetical protein